MTDTQVKQVALVIDDDDAFRFRLCRALADRGWEAHASAGGPSALHLAHECEPDLAIVDLRLPGMNGLDIVKELGERDRSMCIIVLTGYGSIATALTATKLGASHYLSKPADADQILEAYRNATSPGDAGTADGETASVPSLARVEWEHIQRVLADCGGNISQAAKLLGLHRRSLQRKLAKYPPRV
ncbi:MAG: response regulator [Bryobacteraceae bacterium]|nr:response regulator [Bryobacteraceae bacterium]